MAKRFIDSSIFRKDFMRSMEAPYKALFIYLMCECDHAGLWDVELDIAGIRLGMDLDEAKALEAMCGAVVEVEPGKWWLKDFVEFQYGDLNPENRVHESVIKRLRSVKLWSENKGLVSPLQGAKDKEKEKEKEKEKDEDKAIKVDIWPTFEDFWNAYGKKIDRPKCIRAWGRLSQKDREAIMGHVPRYVAATPVTKYRRNPLTYLNGQNWNDDELTRTHSAPAKPGTPEFAAEQARKLAEHYNLEGARNVTG